MATFAHDALRIFTSCKPPLVAHRIAKCETGGTGHDVFNMATWQVGSAVYFNVGRAKIFKSSTSNEVLYRTTSDLEWKHISSQHATFSDV